MLPAGALGNALCSLNAGVWRPCIYMEARVPYDSGKGVTASLRQGKVKVSDNYAYECASLIASPSYELLKEATSLCWKRERYVEAIDDSHDIVAFWMTFMNTVAAESLGQGGIYRATKGQTSKCTCSVRDTLPMSTRRLSNTIGQVQAQYVLGNRNRIHSLIGSGQRPYTHITSPIRRLVDLINRIVLDGVLGWSSLSADATEFASAWLEKVEFLNTWSIQARRLQSDAKLLHQASLGLLGDVLYGYPLQRLANSYGYLVHFPNLDMP